MTYFIPAVGVTMPLLEILLRCLRHHFDARRHGSTGVGFASLTGRRESNQRDTILQSGRRSVAPRHTALPSFKDPRR